MLLKSSLIYCVNKKTPLFGIQNLNKYINLIQSKKRLGFQFVMFLKLTYERITI